jgi:hypothetical protein
VGREFLAGMMLALYLVSGNWSVARIIDVEPLAIYQPRVWAVSLLVLLSIVGGHQARPRPSTLIAELIWFGFTALSILWAPNLELAQVQVIDVGLLVAVALAVHRLTKTGDVERLADSLRLNLLVIYFALAGIAVAGGLGSGRLAVLGGGANVFGRNMGLLCVFALERALFPDHRQPGRRQRVLLWSAVACVAAGLVTLSGSRGCVIATSVAAAVLLSFGRVGFQRKLAVLLGVFGLFLALLLFTPVGALVIESFSHRVVKLLLGERYVSGRDQLYVVAIEGGFARPILGQGIAAFAANTPWPYCHNIVLDAWYETGAIGVLLVGVYFSQYARLQLRLGSRGRELWIVAATLIFVASLFSGGRYDCRGLFTFAALALALPRPPPRAGSS